MTTTGFDELADLAMRKSGQTFRRAQVYLMEARLGNILRRENFATLEELSECLLARPNPTFKDEVVAAMASKDTAFFRDRQALEHIVNIALPAAAAKQEERGETFPLQVLCAGGGTGQEAYSLAMLLDEADEAKLLGRKVDIISLDMCKTSTSQAQSGAFGHFEIQMGLSVHRMLKYFVRRDDAWVICDRLREAVSFESGNMMDSLDGLEPCDIILCRNVLPFMAGSMATELATRLGGLLAPDGLLFLAEGEILPAVRSLHPSLAADAAWCFDPSRDNAHSIT